MVQEISVERRDLIYLLRDLLVRSGYKIAGPLPEEYGLRTAHKSLSGETEVVFDYGFPHYLDTAEGRYTIYGGGSCGSDTADRFWELLGLELDVAVLVPRRNDSLLDKGSLEFQSHCSGPRVLVHYTQQLPLPF